MRVLRGIDEPDFLSGKLVQLFGIEKELVVIESRCSAGKSAARHQRSRLWTCHSNQTPVATNPTSTQVPIKSIQSTGLVTIGTGLSVGTRYAISLVRPEWQKPAVKNGNDSADRCRDGG
jgi:hypothetical protein